MTDTPSLEQGLAQLFKDKQLAPAYEQFLPVDEFLADVNPNALTNTSDLEQLRDDIVAKFEGRKLGHLMSRYALDRDRQLATVCQLGKHPLLALIAQGAMLPDISRELGVAHETLKEFIRKTCTPEELKKAEVSGAEMMVFNAVDQMEGSFTKEDISKSRYLFEARMKIAKGYTNRFDDQKGPGTAIQVNQYSGSAEPDAQQGPPALLNIVGMQPQEELPPLKEHNHIIEGELEYRPEPLDPSLYEDVPDDL